MARTKRERPSPTFTSVMRRGGRHTTWISIHGLSRAYGTLRHHREPDHRRAARRWVRDTPPEARACKLPGRADQLRRPSHRPRCPRYAPRAAMREAGSKPELEIFHDGMIRQRLTLIDEGLLDAPASSSSFGNAARIGCGPAYAHPPRGLDSCRLTLVCVWHRRCQRADGGPWDHARRSRARRPRGSDRLPPRRAGDIKRPARCCVARLAAEFGREVATPAEARELLGIPCRRCCRRCRRKGGSG